MKKTIMKITNMTNKQQKILETLQNIKGFCTAQELHKKIPEINLVTIYRNLDTFTTQQKIRKIILSNQESAYEYVSDIHHHSICKTCQNIKHIKLSPKLLSKIPEIKHFDPNSLEITITGFCKNIK